MAYISSSQIRVFPSVGRSNYDIESQLTNENNLSQLVRSLCRTRKSYVLSNQLASNEPFEFVIYGFYFKILNGNDNLINKLGLGNTLWAGIRVDEQVEGNNSANHYQLLQLANSTEINDNLHDLDVKDEFQGVVFGTSKEDVEAKFGEFDSIYTLHLLENGVVPAQSLLHLNTAEILNGDNSADYISDKFNTKQLNVSESISDAGTLTVTGATTLNTLTANNTQITGTLNVTGETTLSSNLTASGHTITASTFVGSLSGNATTATNFNSSRTFTFSGGDISGSASSNSGAYTVTATINKGAVTNDKLADGTIKTEKLGFDLTMTLTVTGSDNEHMQLTLSAPTLSNK